MGENRLHNGPIKNTEFQIWQPCKTHEKWAKLIIQIKKEEIRLDDNYAMKNTGF